MSTTSDDFVTKIRRLTLFTSDMRRRSSLAADSSDMPFARRMSMTTFADYLPAFRSMRCRALTLSVSGDFISQSMPPIWMSALFTRIRRSRPRISRPCPPRRESAPSQARAARGARCRVSRLCPHAIPCLEAPCRDDYRSRDNYHYTVHMFEYFEKIGE